MTSLKLSTTSPATPVRRDSRTLKSPCRTRRNASASSARRAASALIGGACSTVVMSLLTVVRGGARSIITRAGGTARASRLASWHPSVDTAIVSATVVRRVRLPTDRGTPGAAREIVRAALTEVGLTEVMNEALLLTTELATNGVVHAGTDIDLEVVADRDEVTVTVTDFAEGLPTRVTPNGVELAEGGRGMLLVDHFASSWGTVHQPSGKGVWFRLTRGRRPSTEPSGAVPPFGAPSAAALAALVHSDLRLSDAGSLGPDSARLLGRLCGATAATGGVIRLDQADEGGLAPIAEYGVTSPD